MKKKVLGFSVLALLTLALVTFTVKEVLAWDYCPTKHCDDGGDYCWIDVESGHVGYPDMKSKPAKEEQSILQR